METTNVMKTIFFLVISAALAVSGYAQTRNVLVGTNNAVVQPTNFWSADASNARTGLGLGSAATNPSSAFQPSSSVLTNLSSSNGGSLTNISSASIVGVVGLSTNVTGIVSVANGGTGSTNSTGARTALGLGSAATNPATAFQPSSSVLSNLASGNGVDLTNITATVVGTNISISNVINLQSSLDSKLATNGSATALTNFPASLLRATGDASGLTNFPALNQNTTGTASNVTGVVGLSNGGTGATNASGARAALELGTAATNPSSAFQPSSTVLSNLTISNAAGLTNIAASSVVGAVALASNITGTAPLATNVTGIVSLANGGTAGTNALSARTSLGATTVGANLFTLVNPDDTRFIRLNANNTISALSAVDMRTALSVGTNLGTVTSVGMTVPNIFSLSTSTITSSGTFGLTLANQSSRQAFLVPNGGGIPTFRGIESDDLPSLAISKITGLQTAIDGKLATNGTAPLAVNVTGTVAVANGGTGGTTAESGRTGLGATTIGSGFFTLANPSSVRFIRLNADNTVSALSDSDFRTAIGLGTAATNLATAFQPASTVLSNLASSNGAALTNISVAGVVGALATNGDAINLTNFPALLLRTNGNGAGLTNITAANITGTVALASNVVGTIAISNGGTGSTTAGGARTNLGLGETNNVVFNSLHAEQDASSGVYSLTIGQTNTGFRGTGGGGNDFVFARNGTNFLGFTSGSLQSLVAHSFSAPLVLNYGAGSTSVISFVGIDAATGVAISRTNLGLGWPALTNTTASGFQISLFGTNTNPVLVNTNGEVVSPTNFWQVAPIQTLVQDFTLIGGTQTNNATNARNLYVYSLNTNLGGVSNTIILPTNAATFNGDEATVVHKGTTNTTTVIRQAGSTNNLITLSRFDESVKFIRELGQWDFYHNISHVEPIQFSGTNAAANAAASRTNLGLGITNAPQFSGIYIYGGSNSAVFYAESSVPVFEVYTPIWFGDRNGTNDIFQFEVNSDKGIARTNLGLGATNNVTFSNVTASGTLTATSTVTAKTNLVVEGFVDFTTNRAATNGPTNAGNFNTHAVWITIKAGTNTYFLPAYQ